MSAQTDREWMSPAYISFRFFSKKNWTFFSKKTFEHFFPSFFLKKTAKK
jgi:hypothetical protein